MNSTIIVALISFAGTLVGTAGGIIASGKLTQYRLEQLEKKVDAQSKTAARLPLIEERVNNMGKRIQRIENNHTFELGLKDYQTPF